MRFLIETFLGAQSVFEEVPLPSESGPLCHETLPRGNYSAHDVLRWKCGQQMHMIGHDKEEMKMPTTAVVVSARRVNDRISTFLQNGPPAIFSADSEKIDGAVRHPAGNLVGQLTPHRTQRRHSVMMV